MEDNISTNVGVIKEMALKGIHKKLTEARALLKKETNPKKIQKLNEIISNLNATSYKNK